MQASIGESPLMHTQTSEVIKFNISYINQCAKTLKADVRSSNKEQALRPVFDKGFIVGINFSGNPFVQITYTIDGIRQVSNMAI